VVLRFLLLELRTLWGARKPANSSVDGKIKVLVMGLYFCGGANPILSGK
jgi:hypothetical protein